MSRRPKWWIAFLAKIWPITWISAKMTRWPVIGPLVTLTSAPIFSGKNLNITYLPINEDLKMKNDDNVHKSSDLGSFLWLR